jgi:hypothetical protein
MLANQFEDRFSISNVDRIGLESLCLGSQQLQIPTCAALLSKKNPPHVVIDSNDIGA